MSESPKPPPKPPKPSRASIQPNSIENIGNSNPESISPLPESLLPEPPAHNLVSISTSANSEEQLEETSASVTSNLEKEVAAFHLSDKSLKTLDAIISADSEDESLRKYKEALLGSALHGDRGDINDPRRLIIMEYRVIFAPDEHLMEIVHHLDTPEGLQKLAMEGITLREGAKFKFRISFKVQHDIIVGVKFINKLSKMLFSETEELVLGSYPPSSHVQVFEFPKWDYNEAPKGMLFRGDYKANNLFVDSDGKTHLRIDYDAHIVKG